jgi:hypothetical protein
VLPTLFVCMLDFEQFEGFIHIQTSLSIIPDKAFQIV